MAKLTDTTVYGNLSATVNMDIDGNNVATETWVSSNFDNSGNDYVDSASGSGDGTLTLGRTDGGSVTADLSHSHSEYLENANNLSDVDNATTAIDNLGALDASENLGDVGSASSARSNLVVPKYVLHVSETKNISSDGAEHTYSLDNIVIEDPPKLLFVAKTPDFIDILHGYDSSNSHTVYIYQEATGSVTIKNNDSSSHDFTIEIYELVFD